TGPNMNVATTASPQFYVDSEPPGDATPMPSPEPAAMPEPVETARPTDCACSGIEGTVVIGVCPVESYPPQEDCYPPHQATIVVWTADRTQKVTEFTSDSGG